MSKDGFDIRILGDKKLLAKLKKLEHRMQGKVLREAMRSSMEPVKKLAITRAPVLTGALRKSIKIAAYSRKGVIGASVRTGTRKQLKIPDNAKYYYPAAIEYGTRKTEGSSFLRSSLFDRKGQVLNNVASEIKKILARVR